MNPLTYNPTKWSNTLKSICRLLLTNCLSVFDYFSGLPLKGLKCWRVCIGRFLFQLITSHWDYPVPSFSSIQQKRNYRRPNKLHISEFNTIFFKVSAIKLALRFMKNLSQFSKILTQRSSRYKSRLTAVIWIYCF